MSKRWLYGILGTVGTTTGAILFLVVAIGLPTRVLRAKQTLPGGGVPPASTSQGLASPQSTAREGVPTDGGFTQGIKVHGHWTIEVREPDGRVASRTEFENALVTAGASTISTFLSREISSGLWAVSVGDGMTGANGPCETSTGTAIDCFIAEAGSSKTDPYYSKTLTLSTPGSGFELSGTATAQRNGTINLVRTRNSACASTNAPASPCSDSSGSGTIITEATLSSAVSVVDGQQILVTVTLSFS